MLSISEAQLKVVELALKRRNLAVIELPLEQTLSMILAEDIISPMNVPPADNSAMDGYALHADSLNDTDSLQLSQRIAAGDAPVALSPNTAARIFTGAIIPAGANAVAMQENCEAVQNQSQAAQPQSVRFLQKPRPAENIRRAGEDISEGDCIAEQGTRLESPHLALLASMGFDKIKVYKALKVAVFSTGDELVDPGTALTPGKIYDSNRYMMEAFCRQLGCDIILSARIEDDYDRTVNALSKASETADVILTCGGVSVGEEDHVKAAVDNLGDVDFWKIKMKPGKPLSFGNINNKLFIGLPGNPVSAFVTLFLFGKSALRTLQGESQSENTRFKLPANFESHKKRQRPEFIRVKFGAQGLECFTKQGSGILSSVCWADGLALLPENTPINCGDLLEVYPF
jgi:molybdopterin molybdotransferase